MSDLIDDPDPGANAPEFTVSEISGAVKRMIEGEFSRVRIRAEVGRVSRPRSGHIYLDLKDDRAVLAGVIWKGVAGRLATQPEEGLEVVAVGKLTTFPGQSKYQMVIEDIRPAGVGALMAMLEKRKAALEAEGLFDAARKKPLPYLPEVVGVVTSPSGAVIRDILHRLRDRFPRKVLIWPVAVQGEKCAPEVANAIRGFNAMTPGGALPRPDLVIVARGGGSIEDLWGFNEEVVARAVDASDIPLISAVGHETDTTLIDFVSDMRAPTPTAAAELAVPVRLELLAWCDQQGARLSRAATTGITRRQEKLRDLSRVLPRPDTLLNEPRQRLDRADERLPRALIRLAQIKRAQMSEITGVLRPASLRTRLRTETDRLNTISGRLAPALLRGVMRKTETLGASAARLRPRPIAERVQTLRRDFNRVAADLDSAFVQQVARAKERAEAADRLRQTLGYEATLNRGFAVVRSDDQVITSKKDAAEATALEIQFRDGRILIGNDAISSPKAKPAKKPPNPPSQGSLF